MSFANCVEKGDKQHKLNKGPLMMQNKRVQNTNPYQDKSNFTINHHVINQNTPL